MKTFQALDSNNDGKLSREELLIGYKKIMSAVEAETEVNRIMTCVDTNHSGHIDYSGKIKLIRICNCHYQSLTIAI